MARFVNVSGGVASIEGAGTLPIAISGTPVTVPFVMGTVNRYPDECGEPHAVPCGSAVGAINCGLPHEYAATRRVVADYVGKWDAMT